MSYKYILEDKGPVAEKPSETREPPPFQRHSFPGLDFRAGNSFFAVFSRNFLLEMPFLPFSSIFNTPPHVYRNKTLQVFPEKYSISND